MLCIELAVVQWCRHLTVLAYLAISRHEQAWCTSGIQADKQYRARVHSCRIAAHHCLPHSKSFMAAYEVVQQTVSQNLISLADMPGTVL